MKKTILFLNLICLIGLSGIAQLQDVFTFQKDDTVVRKKYFDQSQKKKAELLSTAGPQYVKDYKDIYEEQYKEVGRLLQSTRVVTEPEALGYLQSVLKKIIDANPELQGMEMRVLFTRDWWPNAYCLMEGTICVNAGLMIYLNNEAELAFILCHELSHFYFKHTAQSITKYVETINSKEFQDELKRLSKEQFRVNQRLDELAKKIVFNSRSHTRDHETEADMQAFNFLKKTGYDCNAIKTALQLLDKIDDDSSHVQLDLEKVFQLSEYPFKKKWIQKESGIFSQLNEKDSPLTQKEKDSLKTHPDCLKRILLLSDSMQKKQGGNLFFVSEKVFNKLKEDFSVEIMEECYREEKLGRNLYYALLMVQSNENIPVAVYSVARCLNRLYERQKNHKLGLAVEPESKYYPPDYNLLLRMLGKVTLDEIANLNYFFCKRYEDEMKNYKGYKQEMEKAMWLSN